MLRTILITILFSISTFLCKANIVSDNILGIWLMANKNIKVEMYKVDDLYFGKVIWVDEDANIKNFSVGAIIIDNMKYNSKPKKLEGGNFYGRGYKLGYELRLIDQNNIEVKVSKSFINQIRYCTKVS